MGKYIIIAEKPSVAMQYASALKVSGRQDGYIENNKWIVTWAVGHLIAQSYPEKYDPALKKWSLNTLPFLPDKWKYEVIPNVRKQFEVIRHLYNREDVERIYYAGDSGREGLYIQELIRQEAGHNRNAKELVVWIDSQTEEEILRGVREAKPLSAYDHMRDAGYLRAKEDYLTGINFSRVLSILYGEMVNQASGQDTYRPIAVGRVMTCVLGMIVEREREIAAFVPTPFFKPVVSANGVLAEWKVTKDSSVYQSPLLYSDSGFKKRPDAEHFIGLLPSSVLLEKKEGKTQKKEAPLLYNLAEIQADCSKRLHIAPNKTLSILQSLYEKKLVTYPRTDARVLTNAIVKKLSTNLNGLYKNPDYKELLLKIANNHWEIKGKYVDDSQVTDHYALIPTGQMPSGLDGYEAKLYDMVVRRFLSAFYPPAVFEKLSVVFCADKEHFFASGTVLKEPGFYEVVGIPKDEKGQAFFKSVSTMKQGESYPAKYGIHNGETQPPKPYTSGSMIIAMENAGKLIEDEELREQIKSCGIGTSATRAATIEKLVKNQYITLNQKTQRLAPTNLGQMIYEVVKANIPSMLSPKMTASWEKGLSQVEHGETTYKEYATLFQNYIKKHTLDMKSKNHTDELKPRIMPFAVSGFTGEAFEPSEASFVCPLCGSPVKTTRKGGFICEKFDKENGCHFYLGAPGARLTEKQAEELIEGKTVGPFQMKGKKDNLFSASLKWEKDNGLQFVFPDKEGETEHLCPNCNKKLVREKWNYTCSCGFQIPRYMKPKWVDDDEVEYLLKEKKSHLFSGLVSKDGKKYSCYLVIKNGKCEREFPPRRKKTNGKNYSFAGDTPESLIGRLCHSPKRKRGK